MCMYVVTKRRSEKVQKNDLINKYSARGVRGGGFRIKSHFESSRVGAGLRIRDVGRRYGGHDREPAFIILEEEEGGWLLTITFGAPWEDKVPINN